MNPRIVCAACKHTDGRIVVGPRHFDRVMHGQINRVSPDVLESWIEDAMINSHNKVPEEAKSWRNAEQGFIDQHGKFYTREEAWKIAKDNGQIIRDPNWCAGSLHSEHLY